MKALFVCLLLAGSSFLCTAHHQQLCGKPAWLLRQELGCIRNQLPFMINWIFDYATLRLGCFNRICTIRRLCYGNLDRNMALFFTPRQIQAIHHVASRCDLQRGYYPGQVWPYWPQGPVWSRYPGWSQWN
ncbi:antimicrobial peptide microplusin-like [Haemaphysalis longicornis]